MSPCGGPSQKAAYKQGDKAFEDVMELLRTKYHIQEPTGDQPFPHLARDWYAQQEALKIVLQEFIWADHCLGW